MLDLLDALNTQDITHPHWGSIKEKGWNHPNLFEGYGVSAIRLYSRNNLFASFSEAKAAVVTINRVQDISDNFVYDDNNTFSDDEMLSYWNEGFILDIDSYKGKRYPAIHIGDIHICKRRDPTVKLPETEAIQYDIHRTFGQDFSKRISVTHPAISKHPEFNGYINDFDDYFHSENAETDQRIHFFPCLNDKQTEHHVDKAYFFQDSWAFSQVNTIKPKQIVDVGSTVLLLGIYSYMAPTISVELRPLPINKPNLTCLEGSITQLPFEDKSVECLSSMCVIEHIGLGRYGDPLDPEGSSKAFHELNRVIAPGGYLIISIPISPEPFISFNANRSFKKESVLGVFANFEIHDELYLYPEPGPAEKVDQLTDFESAVWCVTLKRKA